MNLRNFTAIIVLLAGFTFLLQTIGAVNGVYKIWPVFLILWAIGVLFGEHGIHCLCSKCIKKKPKNSEKN